MGYNLRSKASKSFAVFVASSFILTQAPYANVLAYDGDTTITLSAASGNVGSKVTVNLDNLPAGDSGYIYFDENNNGYLDSGEKSSYVYASYDSTHTSGSLTVPDVANGTYNIAYNSSEYENAGIGADTTYSVEQTIPTVTLTPASGKVGSKTAVEVSGIPNDDSGYIYLDEDNNGYLDSGEPYTYVYVSSNNRTSGTLKISDVSDGAYNIRYESSEYVKAAIKGYAVFNVEKTTPTLTLTPSTGKVGTTVKTEITGIPNDDSGYVYFDKDNNGYLDSEEPYTYVYVSSNNRTSGTLTVPDVSDGKYNITYQSDEYKDAKILGTTTFTVGAGSVSVSGISLDKKQLTLTEGGSAVKLNATISPSNATNKNVSWTSSDEEVATVDSTGTVNPVAEGTATITATSEDGSKTDTCNVTVSAASTTTNKTDYTLSELINDEDTFNSILGKFTSDDLKVTIPVNSIEKVKITQNDQLKLSSFEVTVDSDKVDAVKIKANGKEYPMTYYGDGVYKTGVYNLPKGCEVIFNAYDATTLVDSSVQLLRTLEYTSTTPDKTEYTLNELVSDLELFNEILGSYTLDQIHIVVPQSYISDVQFKYNPIATAIIAIVKNGANKVEFETKVDGQVKTFNMINKGNNRFEGSISGLKLGAEIKIKVYKDDNLVDQIAKKVTK